MGPAVGRAIRPRVAGDVLAAVVAEWRAEDGPCGADSTVRPAPWGGRVDRRSLGNRWSMHRLGRALLMVLTAPPESSAANIGKSRTVIAPPATSTEAFVLDICRTSPPRTFCDDDRQPGRAVQADLTLSRLRLRVPSAAVESGGDVHRATADQQDEQHEDGQVRGLFSDRAGSMAIPTSRRTPGSGTRRRDRPAWLRAARRLWQRASQYEAGGERSQDGVELEDGCDRAEGHQQQDGQPDRGLTGRLRAQSDQIDDARSPVEGGPTAGRRRARSGRRLPAAAVTPAGAWVPRRTAIATMGPSSP